MPQGDDLVGVGFSAQEADLLGNTANTLTCTGTSQATAATVKTKNTTLSAAASQTGAILNSSAHIGSPFYFNCTSSTAAVVYCPVGQTLNGNINDSKTVNQNTSLIIWQASKGKWVSVVSA
ncbi:MAG TPA: hypothetical protein VFR24_27385 [Candidatus Angelobacter sp.]|nr:hypothetical protein [Candidatus Angelobacter sp.]